LRIDREEAKMTEHVEHVPNEVPGGPLRELRQATGLSPEDLAERMDVSPARVAAIEGGDLETLSVHMLRRYVQALGATLHVEIENGRDRTAIL
jgi:transcriptional regulator with XRE-family HTH domain